MREGNREGGKGREWEARERAERKEGREGERKGGKEKRRKGGKEKGREGGRKANMYVQTELDVQLFVPIAEEGFQGPPMTEGSLYQGTAILD